MANQKKIQATTQKFTEIKAIVDDIVLFQNDTACLIIEVRATNFALMSKQEQDIKIYSYASLLNSLSFSLQIYIHNKKIDISSYLGLLDVEIKKTQNKLLQANMMMYRQFVEQLVKVNSVLDKQFYVVISYNPLERGAVNTATTLKGQGKQNVIDQAKASLHSKSTSILAQLAQLNLPAKTLMANELIHLFYGIYNEDSIDSTELIADTNTPIVRSVMPLQNKKET